MSGRNMLLWCLSSLSLAAFIGLCRGQVSRCDDFTDLNFHETFIGTNLNVKLLLFTRDNLDCGRELSHLDLSSQPLFRLTRPTAFVIHGYRPTGHHRCGWATSFAFWPREADMNILVVDWNRGAANLNYYTAVENTRKAAENITSFIQNMEENGAMLASIHLIGVSLGAHVAGFVGGHAGGKDQEDHRGALGHVDLYANGGADQPGCPKTIFSGKSYFVCDHQRSVFLYLCSLNKTCNTTAYPCSSYHDFLDGRCLQCESFKPASCPIVGYHVNEWKDSLLQLGQTKAYFSTTAVAPYCKTNYKVDIVTWNQYTRWGIVVIKLHGGRRVVEARIDHKLSKFEQFTATRLLAQFDEDLNPVQKISLCFLTGNMIGPCYKIRLLRIRLIPLKRPDRPQLCRYDMILEENMEVSFKPMACDGIRF